MAAFLSPDEITHDNVNLIYQQLAGLNYKLCHQVGKHNKIKDWRK